MTVDRFQIAKLDLRADDLVVFSTREPISAEAAERFRQQWEQTAAGAGWPRQAIVLGNGMTVERLRMMVAMKPADVGLDDEGRFL